MEVFEAIQCRRSIGLVSDEAVSQEKIEKILEAGTWAPSHFRTEPWRYFVLTENGRKPLGQALVEIAKKDMEDPSTETNQKKLEKIAEKPFRAPVIIVAAVEPSDQPRVIEQEEYGAVYASIQNMLLATHALGLGGFWRTGKPCYDPIMNNLFGLSEKGKVLGFLYIGVPTRTPPEGKRRSVSEVAKWFSDEKGFTI